MADDEYGDFEEVVNPDAPVVPGQTPEQGFVRARMPR